MTTKEKLDLQWKVRHCIGSGLTRKETVAKLSGYGFAKSTISKYFTAFFKD